MSFKVYVTDYDYGDLDIEKKVLEPIGAEVIGLACKDGKNLDTLASDADALLVEYAAITKSVIDAMPRLKIIARYGVGVDIIDVSYATQKGIVCTNVSGYCNDEVADHNIVFLMMLLKRIPMYIEATRKGAWAMRETGRNIHRFSTLTVGVIGLGRIARNMTKKLQAIGFHIIAYDPFLSKEKAEELGVVKVDLDTLCRESDGIVIQCPYTPQTHHIVGERELSLMKKDAVLLNCSRGKLVDNKALYEALREGRIASAALDDIEDEPAKRFDWKPEDNPLFSLDNCFITPHVAYYSEEAIADARKLAAENVKAVLLGREPLNPVR